MSPPFIILRDFYTPSIWKAWKVGEDLTSLTLSFDLKPLKDPIHGPQTWTPWYDEDLHAEVKKWTPENPKGEDWHQDGDTTPGSKMNHALVLWASNNPTQIRFQRESKIWQPRAFQVVMFHNLHCSHRRPPNAPEKRFLFRQRVEVPSHIKLP